MRFVKWCSLCLVFETLIAINQTVLCILFFHDDVIKWKIFRVTGPLCGEFTGDRWIPLTKASDADLWCFLWSSPWINGWVNNRKPVIWDAIALTVTSLYCQGEQYIHFTLLCILLDNKVFRIDNDYTSARHKSVGSVFNRHRSEELSMLVLLCAYSFYTKPISIRNEQFQNNILNPIMLDIPNLISLSWN